MCMVKSVLNLCIYFTGTHALLQKENGLRNCHQTTPPVRYNYKGKKKAAAIKFQSGITFQKKIYFRTLLASLFFLCEKKSELCLPSPQKKMEKALRTLSDTKFKYNEGIWMERHV